MTDYVWMSKKLKGRVHILGENRLTLCKAENNSPRTKGRLDQASQELPVGRTLCSICEQLVKAIRKRSKPPTPRQTSNSEFYASWEWARVRYQTIKRYGAKCMCCGGTENIVVDHIKPRSKYPDLQLDLENLQVLCKACNRGKSNNDETDFRPKVLATPVSDSEIPGSRTLQ